MKQQQNIFTALVVALLIWSPLADAAAKGNWKNGRIYYRMVCSECHEKEAGGKIAPNEKTKAGWQDYFKKNIHGPQDGEHKYTVDYFVSTEYRESIQDTNRAAKKMLKMSDEQLLADVQAFLVHTAKDSDQPSGCE
jgi:cytochrome c5